MHPCSRASWKTNMQVKRGITSHIYVCVRAPKSNVQKYVNILMYILTDFLPQKSRATEKLH
jgi:hypothetical protein